jgi:hypothetical protein
MVRRRKAISSRHRQPIRPPRCHPRLPRGSPDTAQAQTQANLLVTWHSNGALVHRSFVNGLAIGRQDCNQLDPGAMPYKHNADRRHHITKMKFRVTNWAVYEAGLRRRGRVARFATQDPGRPSRYSDLAIETALTLDCVFGMRLRQTEGLMNSVFDLMGLDIPVPDHTP